MDNEQRDSKNSIDNTEDDEFGDYEGAEDDAPEAVQAIASPSPWVIFPDLLRVQTNPKVEEEQDGISDNKNNANNKMPLQFNINSRQNNMSDGSCSGIRGAIGRETGAIPKQRALDPPDVSLLTSNSQVKLPSTLDLCSSTLRTANRDTTLTHSSIPAVRQSLTNERTSNDNSLSQIVQLERDLKAAQTQKAVLQQQLLQKDTQIRELQSQQRQKSSSSIVQDLSVTSLIESMEKFRSNIEGSFRQLEERMNSLETKLPNLIKSAVENKVLVHNSVQLTNDGDAKPNDGDAKPNDGDAKPAVVDIHMLLEQQKQELNYERRLFLLTFSEILKKTSESLQSNVESNGPKSPHK